MIVEDLPDDLRTLTGLAREVAQERIAPMIREIESARSFSPKLRQIIADAGFFGVVVPEEFGGIDADVWAQALIVEEFGKVFPTAATYLTGHWVPTKMIVRAAQASQNQAEWMQPLFAKAFSGEWLGAIAATEPEAGSDLNSLRARAELIDDEWVINGTKRFITNGGFCDFYVVLARTGGPQGGISAFFVEAQRDGVRAERFEDKMGMHGSATAELVFDDVRVPADHLIGAPGTGFKQTMIGFDEGRVVVGAMSLGIAEGALAAAVTYAAQRRQFGKPIGSFQGLQFLLADMATSVYAARSLVYDAAHACSTNHPDAVRMASMAKLFASDIAMRVTTDAVQVHGGYGYVTDFPVEMLMRDAKINQIYEGTNEIQRMLIARSYFPGMAR